MWYWVQTLKAGYTLANQMFMYSLHTVHILFFDLTSFATDMGWTKASLSSKLWMWNLATVSMWSDLIHVTLWRNDGFLHSFCNFSKSNAFGENFLRTKFILHKIFFQMSILSSRKTRADVLQFMLKNCKKPFVRGHDHFEGKGVSGDKNQFNLFCRKWGIEYFSFNNFFKQKKNNFYPK